MLYFIKFISKLWYPFFHLISSAIDTGICFMKFLCCVFFSSIRSFIFFSKLVFLVSNSSNPFSRFLASMHWVRTCLFSLEEFLITYFLKHTSVNSSNSFSIQFCSLWWGVVILWRSRSILVFGILNPFALFCFVLFCFVFLSSWVIYLWSLLLVTFS